MAKPWRPRLPVFAGLHDKHQVKTIARHLGADTNQVVGALLRVWLKFQADATDAGELKGKTADWLDAFAERPGLAAAMAASHWLYIYHDRLQIPAFDEFVSKKAVKRIENALHVAGKREVVRTGGSGDESDIPPHTATCGDKVPPVPVAPKVRRSRLSPAGPLFDRFWSAYPRKDAKADAEKAWGQAGEVTEELLVRMIAAIGRQAKSDQWIKENGRFIPLPATWVRGRRWEDESVALGAGQRVLPVGRVPAAEGQYGGKRSYEPQAGDSLPPGEPPGLF